MQIENVGGASEYAEIDVEGEAELIAGLIRGVDRCWRDFHAQYDRLIYRCITRVTSKFSFVSDDDVREIYATLMIQLLADGMRRLRTYDSSRGAQFSSWLGLLTIHTTHDWLRSNRRSPRLAPVMEAENLGSFDPSPLERLELKERVRHLESLLQAFSDNEREFVALYYGEGLDPEEVADRLQISLKTVYSKKHKIRSRLEAMLQLEAA